MTHRVQPSCLPAGSIAHAARGDRSVLRQEGLREAGGTLLAPACCVSRGLCTDTSRRARCVSPAPWPEAEVVRRLDMAERDVRQKEVLFRDVAGDAEKVRAILAGWGVEESSIRSLMRERRADSAGGRG